MNTLDCFRWVAVTILVIGLGVPNSSQAGAPVDEKLGFVEALKATRPTIDARARWEWADQKGLAVSHAHTARVRGGLLTGTFAGFQAFGEWEHTEAWNKGSYNASGIFGHTRKTVISDPESSELNRAWVSFSGEKFKIKGGRQRIILDDARHVGNVGWRQNEQTFDAVSLTASPLEAVKVFYAWVYNVNRIFGKYARKTDFESRSHLANVEWAANPMAIITAYAYLVDIQRLNADAGSTDTYGLRLKGTKQAGDILFAWLGELSRQNDADRAAVKYNAWYHHVNGSANYKGYVVGVGREVLGNENGVGYATPLATLHKWNGFADRFLATPADGLEDNYVWISVPLPCGVTFKTFYHHFHSESGNGSYGQEYDFVVVKKFPRGIKGLVKGMFYDATDVAPNIALVDASKVAMQVEWAWPQKK